MPAIASRYQTLPTNSGYSHSINNNPLKPNNSATLELLDGVDTMKNTMFKKLLKIIAVSIQTRRPYPVFDCIA